MDRIKFLRRPSATAQPSARVESVKIESVKKSLKGPLSIFNRNVEEGKKAMKLVLDQGPKALARLIADRKARVTKSPVPPDQVDIVHNLQKVGFRLQDCGGGGNNCLLLSALCQLYPDLSGNEIKSKAQQLRKDIFSLVQASISGYLCELGNSFKAMGIGGDARALLGDIVAIVDGGAPLNEGIVGRLGERIDRERDVEGYVESREVAARIAALQFVYNSTRAGEAIAADAAKYVAKVCQRDVFMLARSEKGEPYYGYYPCDWEDCDDDSWIGKVNYEEVLKNRKEYLSDDAVLIYGRPGHYQAIVPIASPGKAK